MQVEATPIFSPGSDGGSSTRDAASARGGRGVGEQRPADEQRAIDTLKARDREVRAHEAAHLAAAGGHAMGGASFTYKRGPDGVMYAVGGEVPIDTSAVAGDPQASLQKAMQVQRAALAPADPSAQDRQVAAQAAAMAVQSRQELARGDEADATDLPRRLRASGALATPLAGDALHLVA